jgi:acyl-CoA reductase-like NAD-dependent aldehyde dehydrogenase
MTEREQRQVVMFNPFTGQPWALIAKGGPDDVELAVQAAARLTGLARIAHARRIQIERDVLEAASLQHPRQTEQIVFAIQVGQVGVLGEARLGDGTVAGQGRRRRLEPGQAFLRPLPIEWARGASGSRWHAPPARMM